MWALKPSFSLWFGFELAALFSSNSKLYSFSFVSVLLVIILSPSLGLIISTTLSLEY